MEIWHVYSKRNQNDARGTYMGSVSTDSEYSAMAAYLQGIRSVNSVEKMRPYLYANTDAISGRVRSFNELLQGPVDCDPRWLGT
jgi:hypothetical protein